MGTGGGGGGGGAKEWRGRKSEGSTADTARKRPERPWTATRTMEVLRRCPFAIAQRLVHCAIAVSTAVLGQSQGQCPLHCSWGTVFTSGAVLTYLVFTRMPGESYRRRLRSLLSYLCYLFGALINSLVCWLCFEKLMVPLHRWNRKVMRVRWVTHAREKSVDAKQNTGREQTEFKQQVSN